MLVGMVLETLSVGIMIPAIAVITQDDFAQKYDGLQATLQALGNPDQRTLVFAAMLVLVGVYLIKAIFLGFLFTRQTRFGYNAQADLSQRLFTTYLHQPYVFHLQRNSALLIRNVTIEVGMFTNLLFASMHLITEVLVLFGLSTLLLVVEPLSVLLMSALGAAAWAFHRHTVKRISSWGQVRQRHEGLRIQHLQQGLGGAKDVKLLGREADFLHQFARHTIETSRVTQLQAALQMYPRVVLELLAVSGLAVMVVSMLLQRRPLEAVLPAMALFTAAAFRIMPSVNRVLGGVQALRYGAPVIDTLTEELQLEHAPPPPGRGTLMPLRDSVELVRVAFKYPGSETYALRDVNVHAARGESVGFIGASGAGKSTLVDILLGLLSPTSGQVQVDGADVKQDMRAWQDQIGYVPQTIFLTDDTLRRNVAFGMPDEQIDEAAVARAIHAAQLHDFVASLPDGIETLVGERGVRLSGGQRQRIGIARALYHDPAVLVLDEATSSLDVATERAVMDSLVAFHGTKTLIIVAHRFSTVERCDRLYRLEHGRVIDEGHPDELLQTTGSVVARARA